MKKLVIATHNKKKAEEMSTILGKRFPELEIVTLDNYPGAPEPEETGVNYQENATLKAESAAKITGEWCVADDAGLEIDALGGEPGLHSKRFAGEETSFPQKMEIILDKLKDLPIAERGAKFRCVVALSHTDHPTHVFEASLDGRISHQSSGEGGFGYDPIFWVPEVEKNLAELTPDEKHAVSHRGKVLAILADAIDAIP